MSIPEGTIAIPVSPGELLDKISILEIKAARLTDAGKLNSVRFELELLRNARENHPGLAGEFAADAAALKAINESLWDVEDRIRDCERRGDFGDAFVEFARSIYRLNDRRADVKRRINERTLSAIREEKSHPTY
jgi:hypothetical protein